MTDATPIQPDPDFRAHLEWEVTRAARREATLGVRRPTGKVPRFRVGALIAACLALGVAGNFAAAQVRDGGRRDSLLDSVHADSALLMLRREILATQLQQLERQRQVGLVDSATLAEPQAELRAIDTRIARQNLDAQEIRLAAMPPRNDLTAPLVHGRDFVQERIQLDLIEEQQRVTAAEAAANAVGRQVNVGMASALALAEAQEAFMLAESTLKLGADRLALRKEFLERHTPADQLASRLAVAQRQVDVENAALAVGVAQKRLDTVQRLHAAGATGDLEVLRAQLELKEREVEIQRLIAQAKRPAGVVVDTTR
ncbi:MAG TPA: hypothetical protein VHW65_10110 [Gemmatimonadales bacterium]|jgi:hypothetical protein|nr:hypothetical protein [Gemmatimonadales bacterium]